MGLFNKKKEETNFLLLCGKLHPKNNGKNRSV